MRKGIATSISVLLIVVYALSISNASEKGVITFATAKWEPVISKNQDGTSSGLYADILEELFEKRLSMNVVHKELPWKRAQQEVEIGLSDFFITVPTKERLLYTTPSKEPFFLLYLHIYTYKDHPKLEQIKTIQSADDIKALNLTAITNIGNGWHKANIDSVGVKTYYVPAEKNASAFLARKRADIMIEAVVPTNYMIKQLDLQDDLVLTPARFGPIKMHLMMNNNSSHIGLMDQINETFDDMSEEGVVDAITQRYTLLN